MASTPTYVVKRIGDRYVSSPVQARPDAIHCAACAAGGIAMAVYGFFRGGMSGLVVGALGVGFAYRGLTGRSILSLPRGCCSPAARSGRGSLAPSYQNDFTGRAPQLPADEVDEAVMESFPASDPRGA